MSGMGVEYILKNSLLRRSLDNVTVVLIAFSNFKHQVFGTKTRAEESGEPAPTSSAKKIERTRSANLPKYQPPTEAAKGMTQVQSVQNFMSNTRSTVSTSSGANDENDPNFMNTKKNQQIVSSRSGNQAELKPPMSGTK